MLLAIDIGNSNIAFGIYHKDGWKGHWRLNTIANKTSDEYEVLFKSLLPNTGHIKRVVVSSVVPSLKHTFDRMIRRMFGFQPMFVHPGLVTGLRVLIDNPHEIGPDLLANAVAGYHKFGSSCIIVDFGTALSVTVVGQDGDILGVSIAPGLESAMKALSGNTAQLPFVELSAPASVIGKNTIHAIQSGIVFGYVGLVESLVDRIKKELSQDMKVVATGGLAEVIATHTGVFDELEPWLTLDGLRLIAAEAP